MIHGFFINLTEVFEIGFQRSPLKNIYQKRKSNKIWKFGQFPDFIGFSILQGQNNPFPDKNSNNIFFHILIGGGGSKFQI